MRAGFWCFGLFALASIVVAQGGDEQLPPLTSAGPPTLNPPPPLPPQPATALSTRIAFVPVDRNQTALRIEASGLAGTTFLVGVVRPGTSRPVVLTTATLDTSGRWSYERVLTPAQLRALGQTEFVFQSR